MKAGAAPAWVSWYSCVLFKEINGTSKEINRKYVKEKSPGEIPDRASLSPN